MSEFIVVIRIDVPPIGGMITWMSFEVYRVERYEVPETTGQNAHWDRTECR